MDLGISGKRAVVIGGSNGLGLAVSQRLAQEGVNLLIFARNSERLEKTREEISGRYDVTIEVCAGNIGSHEDTDRLREVCQRLGDTEILILNTPRPPSPMRDFLDENEQERWDAAYHDQLHGALLILRKLAPLTATTGWGRIVAITSATIKQPLPRHAISTVFRAGVQAALKHLAMELAAKGVTVNAVAPATVLTPTFSTFHNLEQRVAAVPMKRAGKPEELAATVAYLASVHAGFISGETIQHDGGATLALC
jgi:3-oxoacyl-[acyl-carrier protein] reductase